MTLHAHVSTASSDCDGPFYREYVESLNDDERAEAGKPFNDFHDLHFKERVMGNIVSFHAIDGIMSVNPDGFTWREPTEEGYRSADVRWCTDDCDESAAWQRDVFAEQMGY